MATPGGQTNNLAGSAMEADFIAQREQRLINTGGTETTRPNTLTVRDSLSTGNSNDRSNLATLNSTELLNQQGEITMKDVVLEPQEILALYASPVQVLDLVLYIWYKPYSRN